MAANNKNEALEITAIRRADGESRTLAASLPRLVLEARRIAANVIHGLHGRRRAGKVAQAEAEIGKARQDRLALENQVRLEAMNTLVRLNVAGRLIGAAQMNVEQAKKALDMTQANYNYGAATVLDVTDAQNALVQAEMTLAQALEEHANARATLNYVMGRNPAEAN